MRNQARIRKGNEVWHRVHATAAKKIIVRHLNQAMMERQKTKQAMAKELETSRSQLARLLDPENVAVSLEIIARAAGVLGKRIVFLLEDVDRPLELDSCTIKKSVTSMSSQGAARSGQKRTAS
jgi:antitoxin HicB